MTSFTRTWNSSYEALPTDTEDAKLGAARIRQVKVDVRERFAVDHRIAGDQYDGQHSQVTMQALPSDPTLPAGASAGVLYCKQQSGLVELYFKDSNGNVFPITSAISGIITILPGTILPLGNSQAFMIAAANKGDSYAYCNGQALSRTDFPALFFAIGVIWGGGDGTTTFNVPDLRGRTLLGTGAGVGLTNRNTGSTGGEETHILTIQESPGHQHTVYSNNSSSTPGSVFGAVQSSGNNSSFLTESAGGDPLTGVAHAHNNMPPFAAINWVIKT